MKNIGKRPLALLLAALMLASVSCSTATESGNPDASDGSAAAETAPVPEEIVEEDPLPTPALESRNFDGRTFSIMGSDWYAYAPLNIIDVDTEELTGEALNDATFNRNVHMADVYNCKVTFNQLEVGKTLRALQQQINADDKTYDLALLRGNNTATAITSGFLADMGTMPHLDLSQPWWYHDAIEQLKVGDKRFVGLGYITTNHMNAVWDVCFNSQMIRDYQLEDPYTLVNEGRWTFDKAVDMAATVAHDVDGDGLMGEEDIWGIHHTCDTVIGILNSCGIQIGVMNEGKIEYTLDTPENVDKMLDILTKLFNETYAVDTLGRKHMNAPDSDGAFFIENKALFLFTATHLIWQLRQMDMHFGMLPYPKYRESDDYISTTAGTFNTLVTVPMNAEMDPVGYLMEAYSYEGWKELKPVYFDKVLQGKLARDEESAAMLDYIFSNLSFDAGNVYDIGSMASAVGQLSNTLNTNVASFLASKEKLVNKSLEKFNAASEN